jgi:hypothetical protein
VPTDVSEEHIASIFRVKEINSAKTSVKEVGKLLATFFRAGFAINLFLGL